MRGCGRIGGERRERTWENGGERWGVLVGKVGVEQHSLKVGVKGWYVRGLGVVCPPWASGGCGIGVGVFENAGFYGCESRWVFCFF